MSNKKLYTCCFTGHRPSNLPWGYNEKGINFFLLKFKLKLKIIKAINNGYTYFISGMALGIDIICAEIILKLKKRYNNIQLECAIPCINQTKQWKTYNILRYNKILSYADKITFVSNSNYYNGCMQKRNKYMVDNSSLLICVFNGSNGGTKQTIEYAKYKKIKIEIININKI